jgi:hypothetical protein
MKSLIAFLLICVCVATAHPQPLQIYGWNDGVTNPLFALHCDSSFAELHSVDVLSIIEPRLVWNLGGEVTEKDIQQVSFTGILDSDVELDFVVSNDLHNLHLLSIVGDEHGGNFYGVNHQYVYNFSTADSWPVRFVELNRSPIKQDGHSLNGQGRAWIDCAEIVTRAGVGSAETIHRVEQRTVTYRDILGRVALPIRSGVYFGSDGTKIVVLH